MIRSFADKETGRIWRGERSRATFSMPLVASCDNSTARSDSTSFVSPAAIGSNS